MGQTHNFKATAAVCGLRGLESVFAIRGHLESWMSQRGQDTAGWEWGSRSWEHALGKGGGFSGLCQGKRMA